VSFAVKCASGVWAGVRALETLAYRLWLPALRRESIARQRWRGG